MGVAAPPLANKAGPVRNPRVASPVNQTVADKEVAQLLSRTVATGRRVRRAFRRADVVTPFGNILNAVPVRVLIAPSAKRQLTEAVAVVAVLDVALRMVSVVVGGVAAP